MQLKRVLRSHLNRKDLSYKIFAHMISEQIKLQWVFFLGPIQANIFVGYLKSELFLSCKSSHVYLRYVNDFFVMYVDKLESSNFLNYLNNLHKTLKFTKNKKNITIYKLVKAKNSNRQRVLKFSKNTLTISNQIPQNF